MAHAVRVLDDHHGVGAHMVSKTTIDAMMTAAVRWSEETPGGSRYYWHDGSRSIDASSATAIGQMLWSANWYRAGGWLKEADWATEEDLAEIPEEPTYEYEPLPGEPEALVVLRVIANYSYQTSGEPEEWRPSEPFGFIHALQSRAIGRLPGYADLPWGLGDNDRDIFQRQKPLTN